MFEEKLEIALIRRAEQERKERKDDKKRLSDGVFLEQV